MSRKNVYQDACWHFTLCLVEGATFLRIVAAARDVVLTGIALLCAEGAIRHEGLFGPEATLADLLAELDRIETLLNKYWIRQCGPAYN